MRPRFVTDRLSPAIERSSAARFPTRSSRPQGGWISSTSSHLANWAIFLGQVRGRRQPIAGRNSRASRARSCGFTDQSDRRDLAMAQLEPAEDRNRPRFEALGLSRDAVSLAWTARRLAGSREKEDALKLYGRAFGRGPERARLGRASRGSAKIRAFPATSCPAKSKCATSSPTWSPRTSGRSTNGRACSRDSPIVLIATARLSARAGPRRSRDGARPHPQRTTAIPLPRRDQADPVTLAARAEAFALRSRWKEADQLYRQAIDCDR